LKGVGGMQFNLSKGFEKIFSEFSKLGSLPKGIIKYGTQAFLVLFFIGTFLVVYNRIQVNFDPYFEFVATSMVKQSFTVLAEVVIGALVIDFIFKK
jgi:hypothetical protein